MNGENCLKNGRRERVQKLTLTSLIKCFQGNKTNNRFYVIVNKKTAELYLRFFS
jgi:hypothetical protein